MDIPSPKAFRGCLAHEDQVPSIMLGRVAHRAWDKLPGSPQRAASDALLGCPRHHVPHHQG
eukprot:2743043-Karenia_brevis.AAC.1